MIANNLFNNNPEIEVEMKKYDCLEDFLKANFLRFKDINDGIKHEIIHSKIYNLIKIKSTIFVEIYLESYGDIQELSHYDYIVPDPKIEKKNFLKSSAIEFLNFIFDVIYDLFYFFKIRPIFRAISLFQNIFGFFSEYINKDSLTNENRKHIVTFKLRAIK